MIKSYKDEIKEKSIDLHRYYPDKYKKNTYYNVPKEVADLLEKERKAENRSISQYKYYIKFTLDLNDYISRTYLLTNNTPETILNKLEEIEEQKNKWGYTEEKCRNYILHFRWLKPYC